MPKQLTQEEFAERVRERYGNKYNFSKAVYGGFCSTIAVGCPIHGFIEAKAYSVVRGTWECPICKQKEKDLRCVGADKRQGGDNKRLSYLKWRSMMRRCYNSNTQRDPSYIDCAVCEEWHDYENFRLWFSDNYIDGYALDKDILVKDNKVYSPDTCCFVPAIINAIFKDTPLDRELPRGVRETKHGTYEARLSKYGKVKNIGNFTTISEATEAYNQEKSVYLKELAAKFYNDGKLDERAYNALMKWEA